MAKRVLIYGLVLMLALVAGAVWYLLGTVSGLQIVLDHLAAGWKRDLQIEIDLGTPATPEFGLVKLAQASGVLTGSKTKFSLTNIRIYHSPLSIFTRGSLAIDLEADELKLCGRFPREVLGDLPQPPPLGCMLPPRNLPAFESLRLGLVSWVPCEGASLAVELRDLSIGRGRTPPMPQPLAFSLVWHLGDVDVLTASVTGSIIFPEPGVEGKVVGKLLGRPLEVTLEYQVTETGFSWLGDLKPLTFDLGYLFRWWFPAFKSALPLSLDGTLSLSGCWLYDSGWGLSGNLLGTIQKGCLWFPGLASPVIELNGDLVYAQNRMQVGASNSFFCGEPARLGGVVTANLKDPPQWDLQAVVPAFDLGKFQADLPWALRYSLGWPTGTGMASLSLGLQGMGPAPVFRLAADVPGLRLEKSGNVHEWRGHFEGWTNRQQTMQWRLTYECRNLAGDVPVFPGNHPASGPSEVIREVAGEVDGTGGNHLIVQVGSRLATPGASLRGVWKNGAWNSFFTQPDLDLDQKEVLPPALVFPLLLGR